MKPKHILLNVGCLVMGYKVGKIVGYAKSAKFAINILDEAIPGSKEFIVKAASEKFARFILKPNQKV